MHTDLSMYGGKFVAGIKGLASSGEVWDMGWMPPSGMPTMMPRRHEQDVAHYDAVTSMPRFAIAGRNDFANEKAFLWDIYKQANGGKHFLTIHQFTGCCVGAGGGNTVRGLAAIERVRLGQAEKAIVPFWPLPYGKSREYAGIRGRGDGSLGSTFAKAIRTDGTLDADDEALPKYREGDGLEWGKEVELEWSDGAAIQSKWLEISRKHVVRSTAQCRSADEVRDAIANGYPCTCASDWGGQMEPQLVGTPAVRINKRVTTWNHQMSVHGWWDHPTEKELYWIQNQWGINVHGSTPNDEWPGGFWIRKADMEYICSMSEVFAFSQFDGFPAQPDLFSWYA